MSISKMKIFLNYKNNFLFVVVQLDFFYYCSIKYVKLFIFVIFILFNLIILNYLNYYIQLF